MGELQSREELAEGLHFIDFEQLKIENQTYNEKIEERNEELSKLKKKITTTVQVLSHLKEKLFFMENRNESLRNEVLATEAELAKCRDRLSRHKRVRDKLRRENVELQRKCGLIGKDALLRDFERQRDTSDEYKARLAKLKEMHAEMSTRATVYQ